MDILQDKYSITELSNELNISDHALRYYEKEFKLDIPRDNRGRRYYNSEEADVMYQIKNLRDKGFEIKSIKKILENQISRCSEECSQNNLSVYYNNNEIMNFFNDFKTQIIRNVSSEIKHSKEHVVWEITKNRNELEEHIVNNTNRIESKLERHFSKIDESISRWRERNKQGFLKNAFNKFVKKH